MRRTPLAICLAAGALWCAAPASAGWSPPRAVPPATTDATAVAVDARGEVAVAWAPRGDTTRGPVYRGSVHLWTRDAAGRVTTRRLWSSRSERVDGPTIALGPRGELAVAWVAKTRHQQLVQGALGIVRAAVGTIGRPGGVRTVGRGSTAVDVAVGPRGDALLTWVNSRAAGDRIAAAFADRRRFGPAVVLARPRVVSTPYLSHGAAAAFDAGGNAYLSTPCDAAVRVAAAGRHRFGSPLVLAPGQALGFSLSVGARGSGLATWVAGRCTPDIATGDTPGVAFASALRGGRFTTPVALSPAGAADAVAVAQPPAGGIASWYGPDGVFSTVVGPDGAAGATRTVADRIVPMAADGAGDQVVGPQFPLPAGPSRVAVRPVEGGPEQPAPAQGGQIAVSAPQGRRVALLWTGPGATRLTLSAWRP